MPGQAVQLVADVNELWLERRLSFPAPAVFTAFGCAAARLRAAPLVVFPVLVVAMMMGEADTLGADAVRDHAQLVPTVRDMRG